MGSQPLAVRSCRLSLLAARPCRVKYDTSAPTRDSLLMSLLISASSSLEVKEGLSRKILDGVSRLLVLRHVLIVDFPQSAVDIKDVSQLIIYSGSPLFNVLDDFSMWNCNCLQNLCWLSLPRLSL